MEVSYKLHTFAPVKQKGHGRVAQLNRVADYGSAGYRFESCRGHKKHFSKRGAFFVSVLFYYLQRNPKDSAYHQGLAENFGLT